MIRASGMKNGVRTIAEYDGKEWRFNGREEDEHVVELDILLGRLYPVGGTYVPKDSKEVMNIVNVLKHYFFDMPTDEIETDEKIEELPHESGVIY